MTINSAPPTTATSFEDIKTTAPQGIAVTDEPGSGEVRETRPIAGRKSDNEEGWTIVRRRHNSGNRYRASEELDME